MKNENKAFWSERENALLQEYYYTMSESVLREILPDRTPKDMQQQVALLSRKNRKFAGEPDPEL